MWQQTIDRISDRNIWVVNVATLWFGTSCGMAVSIFALHLVERSYTEDEIGRLAACFALGVIASALPAGTLIRKIGARHTLAWGLGIYALTIAAFPFVSEQRTLAAGIRVAEGAATAAIWIGAETIIVSRARRDAKATVTSLYAMCLALGFVIGPVVCQLVVGWVSMDTAFVTAGVSCLFNAFATLRCLDPDVIARRRRLDIEDASAHHIKNAPVSSKRIGSPVSRLLWRIKLPCLGNFVYGYFQSALVLFLPVYLMQTKGLSHAQIIVIPGFFAAGMVLFVNLAGSLGDQKGHLAVMRLLGLVGTPAVIGLVALKVYWAIALVIFIAGATLASISPLSLALQGVILRSHEVGRGNALRNACHAVGLLLGPLVSGALSSSFGGATMLCHLAALWAAFTAVSWVFRWDDPRAVQRRPVVAEGVS